jgi:flagellar protein FliL
MRPMSASTATVTADTPGAGPAKGKKKLIIIIAAAVLLLGLGGGAAMMLLKKKPADTEESADHAEDADSADHAPAKAVAKHDPKNPPVFVPLDPFTVNLADRDAERYAQVGITLEIDDAKTGEQIKLYMPAIRNNILMAIADRNAAELLVREGKTELAERVKRETARALGYDIAAEEVTAPVAANEDGTPKARVKPKARKKKKSSEPELPIRAVHFSNFIVQ